MHTRVMHARNALRGVLLLAIVILVTGAAWLTWPQHGAEIRINTEGKAVVAGRLYDVPLSDTVYIHGPFPTQLRLVNHDTTYHQVGIFSVKGQETRTYTISTPGVYTGHCSTHERDQITYVIQ